jgi:hypothetical protein
MKLNIFFLSAAAIVNAATAADTVNLGTAGNYAILSKAGISTVPDSNITGDIAVSPIDAAAITAFNLTLQVDGESSTDSSGQAKGNAYAASYAAPTPKILTTAVSDMETAYNDAAGRVQDNANRTNLAGGHIGGLTLTPGLYKFTTDITIKDDITLDGGSEDDSVSEEIFIFQISGNIVQSSSTEMKLSGGAQAKNIFWQVAGTVDVGTKGHMEGIILAKTATTFKTGSSLNGRILTQTRCNLQMATIVEK